MNTVVTSVAGREKEKGGWRRGVWGCGVGGVVWGCGMQVYACYSVKQMNPKDECSHGSLLKSMYIR